MNIVDLVPVQTVPRNGRDQPLVIPKDGGKPVALTRTTTFIDCIEDKSALTKWGKRMVLVGAAKKRPLLDAVGPLDPSVPDDKRKLDALAERALVAAGGNDKREKGTDLHSLSELIDAGKPLPDGTSEADRMDMAAYALAVMDLEMLRVEEFVVCSQLGVGGTPDRIIRYAGPGPLQGKPVEGNFIFDLKTGSAEYGGLKMAAQLAIYSRAEVYDYTRFPVDVHDEKAFAAWKKTVVSAEDAAQAYTPIPPVDQEWGIILNIPSGTGEAEPLWVDLTLGWEAAQEAVRIRSLRSRGNRALRPFTPLASVA